MKYFYLYLLLGLFSLPTVAQNNAVNRLDEVILKTSNLKKFSNTQHVRVLKDSVIKRSSPSLTDILKYHTPIYFKENGLGMVSSVSFRGTTAQQTAVVWNGININSKLLGQTDFNTINISGYDAISVRSGGGSVLYGSGAIGGSVHLNNIFRFNKGFDNELKVGYGSFNTLDARYGFAYSGKKTSVQVSLARSSSDNDYPYPRADRKNLNGQFYNNNLKLGVAYKLNASNTLTFRSVFFDGERYFSLVRPTDNKTKYQDFHTWNLLAWNSYFSKFTSKLKLAYLKESYKYFEDLKYKDHTHGEVDTYIGKYNLGMDLKNGMEIHALFDYSFSKGVGSSIKENNQVNGSVALLLKQKISSEFIYEIGAKKEFTKNYKSPFLFSAGLNFQPYDLYGLKLNFSKNYRTPTFNDMYWQGSGNTNLKPETSHQVELGNYFHVGDLDFSVTGFFIAIKDMIHWVPTTSGLWKPHNTSKVETYGLESNVNYQKSFGNHQLSLNANYGYTRSNDKETGMQLIYVPYHKATLSLGYDYRNWGFSYNLLYNGEVFTRTDNDAKYNMPAYAISNLGLSYRFGEAVTYHLGARVKNLLNEEYQSVNSRFMPGRNYELYLIFKF